jgi:uncharacterized protein (TIGR02147 family)
MKTKKNIFEYIDFRKFLTEWRKTEKDVNPGISYEYLSKKLEQKSRSFFKDVETGRKNISEQALVNLIKLIGLKGAEAKYFRALVGYGQSSSYEEREFWFEQIVELNNTPFTLVNKETYSYYKEWYHSTIRALLDVIDIKDDYSQISGLLNSKLTPNQIKDSIHLLKSLGLVAPNETGYLKPTQKIICTEEKARHELLRQFQVAHHQLLGEILKKDEPGTHESKLFTVSLSREGFNRIAKRINQFSAEIRSIAHKDEKKANRVYKIALHIYPETKEIRV